MSTTCPCVIADLRAYIVFFLGLWTGFVCLGSSRSFKPAAGNMLCSTCPSDRSTLRTAARSSTECLCRAGLAQDGETGEICVDCPGGFYCNGTGVALQCLEGATSSTRSTSLEDCLCGPGLFKNQITCDPCPQGKYKQDSGNAAFCIGQCPSNSLSKEGSRSLADCSCTEGYYAELDSEGRLSRCASCAGLTHFRCDGGFREENGTDFHILPLARAGFYQTGILTAYKCTVVAEDGLSACLGGVTCSDNDKHGESNSLEHCMEGAVGNLCAPGSTGMLCGECPVGWSRHNLQQPCLPCAGATLSMTSSIVADVSLKAWKSNEVHRGAINSIFVAKTKQ